MLSSGTTSFDVINIGRAVDTAANQTAAMIHYFKESKQQQQQQKKSILCKPSIGNEFKERNSVNKYKHQRFVVFFWTLLYIHSIDLLYILFFGAQG